MELICGNCNSFIVVINSSGEQEVSKEIEDLKSIIVFEVQSN